MRLSAFQRKLLKFYQRYQDSPMSLGGLFLTILPTYILLSVGMTVGVLWYESEFQDTNLRFTVVGLVFGAFSRDLRNSIRLAKVWPVLSQVFDWRKLNSLLEQDSESSGR